ncbi:MAG: gliding motility-associated C-terminal domain-containing protein, partial [Bacteroidia bacterium]
TNTVTGLCGGVITVTVTDAAGCSAIQSFTINEDPAMNLSQPIVADITCNGLCNGSIAIVPSGGSLPYNITWIPATTVTPASQLTNLCTGDYTATVTDSKGCNVTTTVSLIEPPTFTFAANITSATCNSSNDGAITTTLTGGTPAYSYTWNGPATYTTQDISNTASGTYTLTYTDINGCSRDTVLTVNASFTVDAIAGNDTSFCNNSIILLDGSNSVNALNYAWIEIPTSNTIAATATTNILPPSGTSTYVLLVTTSVAACFDTDTLVVNSFSIPIVDAGPTQSISLFSSTSIGGSPTSLSALTYSWLPSNTLNDPTSPNPTASNTVNTTYTVFITDANGCTAFDTVQVFIYPEIKIPNGFSPNADGRNDSWIIDNIQQFSQCEVEVYNRWGELLFYSKGYNTVFDGRYKNKDLPVGTYYYIIKLNHDAYPKPYTGPLTIFR